MFCKEYKFISRDEENDAVESLVWVELYSDSTPSPLPTNAVGIDNFPESFDAEHVKFAPGSVLYVVANGDIYMASSEGTFIKQ